MATPAQAEKDSRERIPDLPKAPKARIGAKARGIDSTVFSTVGEGMTARDLASDTEGPLQGALHESKDISRELVRRDKKETAMHKQLWSKKFQTGRRSMAGGKR
jgi:hypothetical protein